jgi:hypothetical protein
MRGVVRASTDTSARTPWRVRNCDSGPPGSERSDGDVHGFGADQHRQRPTRGGERLVALVPGQNHAPPDLLVQPALWHDQYRNATVKQRRLDDGLIFNATPLAIRFGQNHQIAEPRAHADRIHDGADLGNRRLGRPAQRPPLQQRLGFRLDALGVFLRALYRFLINQRRSAAVIISHLRPIEP